MLDVDKGQILVRLAHAAIANEFGFAPEELQHNGWMKEPGATFVTLTLHGQLRGCIGSLEAHRPLIDDVRQNAVASAFRDPRFPPLTKDEFAESRIEVALLTTPEAISFTSEEDALGQLHPGRDGVILSWRQHRATYLPQVWEQLRDPHVFIEHLKIKAGLPGDFWADDIRLARYSVQKWREGGQNG